MGEEREILKYELDITDFEAKAARIQELSQAILKGRTGGEDVSELERQLNSEVEALQKSLKVEDDATVHSRELAGAKRDLASVVGLVSGNVGGLAGQLGRAVQLLMRLGPTATAAAISLAGVTAAVAAWGTLKENIAAAREEMEKYEQAVAGHRGEQLGVVEQMEGRLGAFGLQTSGGTAAARKMLYGMGKLGYVPEEAGEVGAGAIAAGFSAEDAATLWELGRMGYAVGTPWEARETMAKARPEHMAQARRQVGERAGTEKGKRVIAGTEAFPTGTPIERLHRQLREQGEAIEISELREKLRRAEEVRVELENLPEGVGMEGLYWRWRDQEGNWRPGMRWSKLDRERLTKEQVELNRYEVMYKRQEALGVGGVAEPSPGLTPDEIEAMQQRGDWIKSLYQPDTRGTGAAAPRSLREYIGGAAGAGAGPDATGAPEEEPEEVWSARNRVDFNKGVLKLHRDDLERSRAGYEMPYEADFYERLVHKAELEVAGLERDLEATRDEHRTWSGAVGSTPEQAAGNREARQAGITIIENNGTVYNASPRKISPVRNNPGMSQDERIDGRSP